MRLTRVSLLIALLVAVLVTLFGESWWVLVAAPRWPTPIFVVGSIAFGLAPLVLPTAMVLGHGRRHIDRASQIGDTLLGVIWVLFACSPGRC